MIKEITVVCITTKKANVSDHVASLYITKFKTSFIKHN